MKKTFADTSSWSTASFGGATDPLHRELSSLGAYLNMCKRQHGGLVSLRYAAESMSGFIAARFVTTLVVLLILVGSLVV